MSRPVLLRRVSVGVLDQIVSGGSNFLAMVVAARVLTVAEFGAFSLAMVTYGLATVVFRPLSCDAVLIRPGTTDEEIARHGRDATASTLTLSTLGGAALVAASLTLSGSWTQAMLVLGIALPVLMVQDVLRYVAFGRGRPMQALVGDGVWLVGQLVGFALLLWINDPSPALVMALWGVPSFLGAVTLVISTEVFPTFDLALRWVRQNSDLSLRYLADAITGHGAGQLAVYAVVALAGLAAAASIRGAQTLFGAVAIIQVGASTALVPEGQRMAASSPRSLRKLAVLAGIGYAALAVVALAVVLVLPDSIGTQVLGETWHASQPLLVPVGVAAIASGVLAGALVGLRAMAAAAEILRVRIYTMPVVVAAPIVGAVLDDARGAGYGILLGVIWNSYWTWRVFLTANDQLAAGGPTASGAPTAAEDRLIADGS